MLSLEQLLRIMPMLKREKASAYLPHLNAAMAEAEINTPARMAAFLAQLAHESGQFRYMEEVWGPTEQQLRYDPPSPLAARLGNVRAGDGKRYMGRGPIQITGRANYRTAGKALKLELEVRPEMAASAEVGFRVAAWFWTTRELNELADKGDFKGITRKINGGYNGLADREKYHERALAVLAEPQSRTTTVKARSASDCE